MGETDLVPPKPPAAKEEGEDKAKKGFFKSVFKKKDKKDSDDLEIPSPVDYKSDKVSGSEIDEISKLIDDTINDIQKLQTSNNSPKEEVKEPKEVPKIPIPSVEEPEHKEVKIPGVNVPKEEISEPATIPSAPKETQKVIVTKKAEPKPMVKPVVQKTTPVKKVVAPKVKKVVKKVVKKSYDLPAFDAKAAPKKVVEKKKVAVKADNTADKIKALEKELEANKIPRATAPFVFKNGKKAYTAKELLDDLKACDDSDWSHHVTDSKNDFANWIKLELKNPDLAKEFSKFFMKNDAINALEKNLPKQTNPVKIKALEKEIFSLKQKKLKEDYQNKLKSAPSDFFKVDDKTVKSIIDLEKAITNMTQKEFSDYVSLNKQAFSKWLEYLAKDYKKDIASLDSRYKQLSKKVLTDVNSKVDAKVKTAKKQLDDAEAKLKKIKVEVTKLSKDKTDMINEQKTLAEKKKTLMAEISKVSAEHKQVHELKEKTQKEKDILHNEIEVSRAALKKEKADHAKTLKEAKTTAKKELDALAKEAKSLKSKIVAEENKIKKQHEALAKKQEEIEKRDQESKKRETAVTKREEGFRAEKERIERLVKNFEEREKQIELQKSELEVAGFEKYLSAKLKELHPSEPEPSTFDIGVEDARNMLNNADLEGAKRKYLQLKQDFDSSGLSGSEKDRVYNLLRELYDDIMLAVN